MATDKVTIDRELLEQAISTSIHEVPERIKARSEIRAILAAPRQPEGEAASILLPALRQYMHNDGSGLLAGYEYERTQQIVAELREVNRIQLEIATVHGAACVGIRKQRDKLAGLLREADTNFVDGSNAGFELSARIAAALAEVNK